MSGRTEGGRMKSACSLHCGSFAGVSKEDFEKNGKFLRGLFDYVHYDEQAERLEITGARDVYDSPDEITSIFNKMARLLKDGGRGKIMLQCEASEICYFRRNMWKLMSIHIPPDPFDDIRYVQ
jgi:hypothetical protein